MLARLFNRCLLRPGDVTPSQAELKVMGVFNPGVVETPQGIVLLVRVAETARERQPGYVALPRRDGGANRVVLDWLREAKHRCHWTNPFSAGLRG